MLLEFSIENFRSIKERQSFSFEPAVSAEPHPNNILSIGAKQKLLASGIIYGPNASGKSNVLKALRALEYLILESGNFKLGSKIAPYEPYKLDKKASTRPIRLSATFIARDGIKYEYEIAYSRTEIIYESLHFYPRTKRARIFERKANEPIAYGENYRGDRKTIENQLLENQLFLSKAANSNVKQLREVYLFFKERINVIANFFEPIRDQLQQAYASRFLSNNESRFREKFNSIIRSLDTGISSIDVEELDYEKHPLPEQLPEEIQKQIRDTYKYDIKTRHGLFDGSEKVGETVFDIREESDGTQRLFGVAGLVLDALEEGSVLIIDEFEKNLHPHIISFLIRLFHEPKYNTKNAQLLVATHDITQLNPDQFRKDQIWFTQKDNKGATSLYSLADFRSLRKEFPFDKWYSSGRFFAVPQIRELDFEISHEEEKETA